MFIISDCFAGNVVSNRETAEELEATIVTPEELVDLLPTMEEDEVYGCEMDETSDIAHYIASQYGIRMN